ncbi:hypothetical protein HN937_14075, partial [Candidatus Poribacteria bacterium]|nr:hypothetical protein [Candidatus Poribacteria bacterium]
MLVVAGAVSLLMVSTDTAPPRETDVRTARDTAAARDQAAKRKAAERKTAVEREAAEREAVAIREAARARDLAQTFKDATRACRKEMARPEPDWEAIDARLVTLQTPELSFGNAALLSHMRETCALNTAGEADYAEALRIVNSREVKQFAEAERLLKRIDERARIYPDAEAYMAWLASDRAVRAAKSAFDAGDSREAFKLLGDALRTDALGPEAVASVKNRRQTWARVVRAYERGQTLTSESARDEARQEFEQVLELVANDKNWYHQRAREYLNVLPEPPEREPTPKAPRETRDGDR